MQSTNGEAHRSSSRQGPSALRDERREAETGGRAAALYLANTALGPLAQDKGDKYQLRQSLGPRAFTARTARWLSCEPSSSLTIGEEIKKTQLGKGDKLCKGNTLFRPKPKGGRNCERQSRVAKEKPLAQNA